MNKQRTSEAIDWFMRLCEDDVSESDLSAWIQWCADPDNLREFQGIRAAWRGFDRLGPAASELLETVLESESVPSLKSPRPRLRGHWAHAIAAALLASILAGLWYTDPFNWGRRAEIFARSELKSTVLPDGSTLTLAPRTQIAVDFAGPQRSLKFANGEAYFKVRADRSKPFVVHTAGLKVTAIGTAFDVRSEKNLVMVTVQEGVVEVATASDAWRLRSGHRLTFNTESRAAQIDAVDLARAGAWHEGRLEYFAIPLSTVVADINRYSARSVELGDPQLAHLEYTGSVFTRDVDDWLAAIEVTFPVRILVARDDHIVLLNRTTQTTAVK
jgi:transmembrane sensor